MDHWLLSQDTPSSRFQEPRIWEDEGIYQNIIEEISLKKSIQGLLTKLLANKNEGVLSSGESFILHNLLKKYQRLKKKQASHIVMNLQSHQMQMITENLSVQQRYIAEINKKRKEISKFIKSKASLPKQLDVLEKKLTHDIDNIDPLDVITCVDNAIKPATVQLEESTFEEALYNEHDGLLVDDMKSIISSCVPVLPDGQFDSTSVNIIAEECLKKCLQKEPISMKDIPVTQYHLPTVPCD